VLEDRTLLSTVSWIGPSGGDWDTGSNWSTGLVPTASDDVQITQSGAAITHQYDHGDQVNSLTSSSAISLSNGSLSIATTSTISNGFTLNGGVLDGSGTLTVTGLTTWSGGSMTGTGTTIAQGGMALGGGYMYLNGWTLDNTGTATWTGDNYSLYLYNGAAINNETGATWDFQTDASIFVQDSSTPVFTNQGMLKKSAGAHTTNVRVEVNNSGTIDAQSGTLSLQRGGTSTGSFAAETNATLDFQDTGNHTTFAAGSLVCGPGTISFSAGTDNVDGAYTVPGTTSITGAFVDFSGSRPDTLGTLILTSGALTGSDTVTVTALTTWAGGTIGGPGVFVTQGDMVLGGGFLTLLQGTLDNAGTATWTGGGSMYFFQGSVINNEVGALWNFQSDAYLSVQDTSNSAFNNLGLLEKTGGTSIGTTLRLPVNNSGTIDAQSSILTLQGGGSSSGTLTVEPLGVLEFQTTAYSLAATSSATGQGTIDFGSSNATTVAGTYNVGTTLITDGEVDFNSTATTGTLNQSGGTLGGTGTFMVSSGASSWTSGTMSGTGTTVLTGTSSLTLGLALGAAVHLDGGRALDNYGTLTWPGPNENTFTISNGASFTNEAGAVFDDQAGNYSTIYSSAGGSAAFTNAGTFLKESNSGTTYMSVPFSDTGVLDLQVGTLAVQGSLPINGEGVLSTGQPFGTLTVGGDLSGTTQNAQLFAPLPTVTFNGSGSASNPQYLEVMSQDEGAVAAGFAQNFAYNQLTLTNYTYVQLVDNSQNLAQPGPEALYVNSLVVPSGCTLHLNGLHVYVRQEQIGGTIVNGSVTQLTSGGFTSGGALNLGTPAPGSLVTSSQVDNWTFFGRAGQTITAVVNTGNAGSITPLQPYLGLAQVSLLDANNNVLASGHNTQSGTDITLAGASLPADGGYTVQVQGLSGSTGNYEITATDATTQTTPLNLNETVTGQIDNPYRIDLWTFSASAGQEVQFNLVSDRNPAVVFDLTGPNGYVAFSGQTSSSGPISLPSSGSYVVRAYSTQGQTGAYAFHLDNLTVTTLTLNTQHGGQFAGSGQAQLFQVTAPGGQPLVVNFQDQNSGDVNELYVKFGAPPTRADYQYRGVALTDQVSGLPDLVASVPLAAPGTWYILVYNVTSGPFANFTLQASTGVTLTAVSPPGLHGTSGDAVVTLTGTGFDPTMKVTLITDNIPPGSIPNGTTYAASSVQLVSSTQLTATFLAGSVPAGAYDVQVTRGDGSSSRFYHDFFMVQGGKPANLIANLNLPSALGFHIPGTLQIHYANNGQLAMPAPLVVLKVTQTHSDGTTTADALMTLDASRMLPAVFGSAILPDGFSHTIQVLSSGQVPGTLQPGESVNVPVYWAGWQQPFDLSDPPFDFSLGVMQANDPTPVDWASMKDGLRPASISAGAWDPIFANLTSHLGSTWGSVVTTFDADAAYLGQLGENVVDVSKLWAFEIQQAVGFSPIQDVSSAVDAKVATPGLTLGFGRTFANSIDGHYETGPLGYGWFDSWASTLSVGSDGTVTIQGAGGSQRFFQPDKGAFQTGGYLAEPGDYGTLTVAANSDYLLTEKDGSVTAFLPTGAIDYMQDTNGNRITAVYNSAGQLASLMHSSGQYLNIAYNSAGLIASITDSDNRTTTYTYDPTNQFLLSVTGFDGRTTSYTYDTSAGTATGNALLSVAYPAGTHDYFSYDSQGRLSAVSHDGNALLITFTYGPGGMVTASDAVGGSTTLFFNEQGLVVKAEDALQRDTELSYDNNYNLVQVTDAAGQTVTNRYDSHGNLIGYTDPAGNSVSFIYTGPFNKLGSYTDAKGNTTAYSYSSQGNLLAITYPNNSIEQFSYDPLGNLIDSINRRGQAIGYSYNTSGQLTRESFADGSHFDYTYDGNGNLITAVQTNADGSTATTTLTYDPVTEDLLQITYPGGRFLKFSYDAGGRRIQSVDQDTFTVNYQYNAVGQLAGLTDGSGNPIVNYTYDDAGRLIEKDLGNRTYTTYQYDLAGQLLHLVNYGPRPGPGQDGPINSRFDYTYDVLGRVNTMTTLDGQWTYTYDPNSQLTNAVFASNNPSVTPNQNLQYFYDAAGNRTQTILNGVTTAYTTNNLNEYTSIGSTNNLYDADGNLISQNASTGTTSYSYNQLNQLTGVTSASGTWSYTYDDFGNRNSVMENGQTTQYLIDPVGLGNVVGAYSGAGATQYIYGLGLISQVNSTGTYYYDFDRLGSTAGITGALGGYANKYSYLPFGETTTPTSGVANPFTFVGQWGVQNHGDGLFDMRVRNYDSSMGQFTSPDPLGLAAGSTNWRQYVDNNALAAIDPTGLNYTIAELLDNIAAAEQNIASITSKASATGVINDVERAVLEGNKELLAIFKQHLAEAQANASTAGAGEGAAGAGADEGAGAAGGAAAGAGEGAAGAGAAGGVVGGGLRAVGGAATIVTAGPTGWQFGYPRGEFLGKLEHGTQAGQAIDNAIAKWVTDAINAYFNSFRITPVKSQDPNDSIGPGGYGPQSFVALNTLLAYRIDFENQATATAPAQVVTVTDQLDPNLDWSTFQFTEVGFGNTLITIPAGLQHYQTTVAMIENGESFNVEIELSMNPATGQVTATFQSINPNTGLPPDVLTGFLPPEDGSGRGSGHFSYTILPKIGLATGTQIRNVALVTFDTNPSIATDQVNDNDPTQGVDPNKQDLITIDSGAPVSSTVLPLPATSSPSFVVSATGQDDSGGSGTANFDIYVSDNGGPFTLWVSHMTGQATFQGTVGHTYGFYSVAYDNVGNQQPQPPGQAQATTQVVYQPTVTVTDGGTYNGNPFNAVGSAVGVDGKTPVSGSFSYTYYASVGSTVLSGAPTNAGSYYVVAAFTSSDSSYGNGTSAETPFAISPATPSVSVTDGGTYNTSPFNAVGSAIAVDGKTAVSGSFSYTYYASDASTVLAGAPTNAGSYYVVAAFSSSDTNYGNATSAKTAFTISQAGTTTTATISPATSVYGQTVSLTVTVSANAPGSGTPTGAVTILVGTTILGTGTLKNGVVTFSAPASQVGSFPVTASYGGDSNFISSSAKVGETVSRDATTTTLTSSANPSAYGQAVTFTATVTAGAPGSGIPTGTVTFKDGTVVLGTGTLTSHGQATLTISTLKAGKHYIRAVYASDAHFKVSTSSALVQQVNKATAPFDPRNLPGSNRGSSSAVRANPAIGELRLQSSPNVPVGSGGVLVGCASASSAGGPAYHATEKRSPSSLEVTNLDRFFAAGELEETFGSGAENGR
jgi:RHS repeat-associated protein